jgi:hypothetical protein
MTFASIGTSATTMTLRFAGFAGRLSIFSRPNRMVSQEVRFGSKPVLLAASTFRPDIPQEQT